MAKYKNKKIEVDGIVFDSKKEAKRYRELKLLEQAGEITDLQMQVKFELIPKQCSETEFTKAGKPRLLERECSYIADFVYKVPLMVEKQYTTVSGENETINLYYGFETVAEDTKGFKTKDYIIKRKLMLYVHGIRIKEI